MKKILLLTMQLNMVMHISGQILPNKPNIGTIRQTEATAVGSAAANINPNVPPLCEACDPKLVKINVSPGYTIQFLNDQSFSLGQLISITTTPPKPISAIKAELSYFEFLPESENCLTCNTNSATFGNFNSGTATNVSGTVSGTHALNFAFNPPKPPGNFPLTMVISMPPTVNCCEGLVRICITYTVVFEDCTACTRLVCYERKKGSNIISDNPHPINAKSR